MFGPGRHLTFLILYTIGGTLWKGDQSVARPIYARRTAKTQNKKTQASMPLVRLQATTAAFKRAKIVHALDLAVTLIGSMTHH
jgi:hypothetical protein